MGKRRGDYIGGSTMISASGHGFTTDPDFPSRKRKKKRRRPEDRTVTGPKLSAAEMAEYKRLRNEMTKPTYELVKRRDVLKKK